ncbi:MAG: PDZ domain-containing protein [candidate division KSB1 bacterium]|nr:PDZ domain-containing protein [candidate division KSB1 bacterium]
MVRIGESDIAVIKIDASGLQPIKIGNSEDLQVGEWVLAIGNPFSAQLDQTVTAGIVSAKGRTGLTRGEISFEDFIQTDAAINPGNSGGALVNLKGELVGINTMIFSRTGGNLGIGFAIPVNWANNVMEQLITHGKVSRGWLGVMISNLDEEMAEAFNLESTDGALVSQVVDDSPAQKAGLKEGDVIIKVEDKEIKNSNELVQYIAGLKPNTKVDVVVWREGDEKKMTVKLGERPQGGRVEEEQAEEVFNQIGLQVSNLTPQAARQYGYEGEKGVIISDVKPGSVASRENIRVGDLIISVNRKPVNDISDFNRILKDAGANDVVLFRMRRGNTSFFTALRIPDNE